MNPATNPATGPATGPEKSDDMDEPTQPLTPESAEATRAREPEADGGRHRVIVPHLVMGVAFLGLLVVWALVASDTVNGTSIRFLLPVPWVLAGAAGLGALLFGERRRPGTSQRGWSGTMGE